MTKTDRNHIVYTCPVCDRTVTRTVAVDQTHQRPICEHFDHIEGVLVQYDMIPELAITTTIGWDDDQD